MCALDAAAIVEVPLDATLSYRSLCSKRALDIKNATVDSEKKFFEQIHSNKSSLKFFLVNLNVRVFCFEVIKTNNLDFETEIVNCIQLQMCVNECCTNYSLKH
jgi:hypothetical protein